MHTHRPVPAPTGPQKILIVDDDEIVGGTLRRLLEHGGASVGLASSVATARAALDNQRFDAIVADYDLGSENSEALLTHVRDAFPAMRRVLCSGCGAEVAARVLALGLAHCAVPKPLGLPELRASLGMVGGDSQRVALGVEDPPMIDVAQPAPSDLQPEREFATEIVDCILATCLRLSVSDEQRQDAIEYVATVIVEDRWTLLTNFRRLLVPELRGRLGL